jgi:dihydrofolate synthase/folylpolyglutamate synthase
VSPQLQHALEALYGLERRKDKLGLEGTRALLAALGNPQDRFRSVHVAGTNGKGSVCALVSSVLREAGLRTGLFTSPHLVDFRERIRVDGQWADEARLAARLEYIQSLPEGRGRTFFEVCTALAFDDLAARGVEWGVIEVGLGGRLDCTNVITPEVCVITSIGLDHTEILGDRLELIAAEKAGIIKPGVPVVNAAGSAPAAAVVRRVAAARGAPVTEPVPPPPGRGESGTGAGGAPARNAATAAAVLETLVGRGVRIPPAAIAAGLSNARWPGRFERCPGEPRLWWDGAHNPDGARVLRAWCEERGLHPSTLVFATSRDKDASAFLGSLAGAVPTRRVIATRSRSERATPPEELAAIARAAGWSAEIEPNVATACRRALERATEAVPALLTGSLFAVGEAMETFGGAPGEWL